MMAEKPSCGDWIKSGRLGSGSFGTVTLWENKVTKQKIAVKTCWNASGLSLKNQWRWKQEVNILQNINHPNVIKALPLPEALRINSGSVLPALCMEYCEGGDLRKTLSTVENCCGLKEKMILKVCGDIASAIQCLHDRDIAHRDLKPENIVVSQTDNRIIFKVIDLGYAKQLGQSGLQHSNVGTPQYLAPEIVLGSKDYTLTVDYWSYGCLMFECCTGFRPFLHSEDVFKRIKSKDPRYISVSVDDSKDGKLTFSDALPEVNQLNRVLQPKFEELLRFLLDGCPKRRGGNKIIRWIHCVEGIIATKVVNVFCIDSCSQFTYEFSPELSAAELMNRIYQDTGIPVEKQELFLLDGRDLRIPLEAGMFVFVVNKVFELEDKADCFHQLPSTVKELLGDPDGFKELSSKRHMDVFRHCVFFIKKQEVNNCSLTRGLKALVIRFLKRRTDLSQKSSNVRQTVTDVQATVDFFKLSLSIDMKKYRHFCEKNGISHDLWKNVVESWRSMEKEIDENKIFEDGRKIFDRNDSLICQLSAMRNIESVKKSPERASELLAKRVDEIRAKYEQMRKPGERSSCRKDKVEELGIFIGKFLEEMEKINEEFYKFLRDLTFLRPKVEEIISKLESLDINAKQLKEKVRIMQEKRQEDIWRLLYTPKKDELQPPKPAKVQFKRSTSRTIRESHDLVTRVRKTLETINDQQETIQVQSQNLDWSFCDLTETKPAGRPQ